MISVADSFQKARDEGRLAFIPYIMSGFPDEPASVEIAKMYAETGADIIELGVPFSDPLADGPTIQRASNRALANGTTLRSSLEVAENIAREVSIPIVMMSYYNPILRYGVQRFFQDASNSGISAVIIPDLLPEESEEVSTYSSEYEVGLVFLVAPTSTVDRIKLAAQAANAFLYCVSLTGVTGARDSLPDYLEPFLRTVRGQTDLPLVVGFGISKPDHIRQLHQFADGVVVASAIISMIENSPSWQEALDSLRAYLGQMRAATFESLSKENVNEIKSTA
ncbi:tryptophan synthase, alpha subunit [Thermobaculum terrenum ATCC BAA-798]|uniref:Tryptophan synthase alpha chain n=1 Tax=Thermobaculum terrenum (strain ATCC BAA-798 / CCMEE 7001 / YNP1) TaxID=525904 RepID=D1CBJ1_THET1|nr:tryptophan synthase subunit alpha [Thermobaculum terrenum]ACZ42156.1 tryptophan synthase, alpha subunit [Thermobaculum terrenum ATCC BAA-798]